MGGEGPECLQALFNTMAGIGQPLDYSRYNITSSSTDGLWRSVYDVLMDLKRDTG